MINLLSSLGTSGSPFAQDTKSANKQPAAANSFLSRFSELLSATAAERKSARPTTRTTSVQSASVPKARQGNDAARPNSVTTASAAPKAAIAGNATAKVASTVTPASAATPFAAPAATPLPATDPVTSTPPTTADVVSALLKQNGPPAPYGTAQAPSTDSSVYMGGDYLKLLNLNFFQQQVNRENQQRYDGYEARVQGWANGGMQGNPPQAPLYQSVDLNGFNQWWDTFNQNLSAGAPPQTFIANAMPTNGYGGASMFSSFSV